MSLMTLPCELVSRLIEPQSLKTLLSLRATSRFLKEIVTGSLISAASSAHAHILAMGKEVPVSDFQKIMFQFCSYRVVNNFTAASALFRQVLCEKNGKMCRLPTHVLHSEWIMRCEQCMTVAIRKQENAQTLQKIWKQRLLPALILANPGEERWLRSKQDTHVEKWMRKNARLLQKVTELNLAKMQLRVLPPQIFWLTELKKLNLSDNPQLVTLPKKMSELTNLEELDLGNRKKEIIFPQEINNLKKLRRLIPK